MRRPPAVETLRRLKKLGEFFENRHLNIGLVWDPYHEVWECITITPPIETDFSGNTPLQAVKALEAKLPEVI